MNRFTFGKTLKQQRTAAGLTRRTLADKMQVSVIKAGLWEWGILFPKLRQFDPLVQALHLQPSDSAYWTIKGWLEHHTSGILVQILEVIAIPILTVWFARLFVDVGAWVLWKLPLPTDMLLTLEWGWFFAALFAALIAAYLVASHAADWLARKWAER